MLRPSAFKILILGPLLPGAALALGLGDIQVESALHQPLAAQIEIVGASPDSSAGLSATIPDSETFQRYGLERPASLASTGLTVRQDTQGHTVLVLRSTDAFTEPMVTFLVDLHSSSGELIREYTILLDPPGLAPEQTAVESALAQAARAPTPTLATRPTAEVVQTPPQDAKPTPDTYTVAPRDTLDRIAGIAGAHSRSDRRKMMIAIFRANPGAFQTNLNNLHSGALLHLPSVADLSKLSADEANREFAAQMAAWHASDRRLASTATAPTAAAPASAAPVAVPAGSVAEAQSEIESKAAETAALAQRVESLEKSLDDMKQKLRQRWVDQQPPAVEHAVPIATEAALESGPTSIASKEHSLSAEDEPAPAPPHRMRLVTRAAGIGLALAAGIGLTLAVGAWIYRRRRSEDSRSEDYDNPHADVEQEVPAHRDSDYRPVESSSDLSLPFQKIDLSTSYLVEEIKHDAEHARLVAAHEPTVKLPIPRPNNVDTTAVLALHADLTNDDTAAREFAFFNPESTLNTPHVMIADGAEEPQQIAAMGKAIAPDDELFANGVDKKAVA